MSVVFNPPPGWPAAPAGWTPPCRWTPPKRWPAAPPGWEFYIESPDPSVSVRCRPASAHVVGYTRRGSRRTASSTPDTFPSNEPSNAFDSYAYLADRVWARSRLFIWVTLGILLVLAIVNYATFSDGGGQVEIFQAECMAKLRQDPNFETQVKGQFGVSAVTATVVNGTSATQTGTIGSGVTAPPVTYTWTCDLSKTGEAWHAMSATATPTAVPVQP